MKKAILILCGALLSWNASALAISGIPGGPDSAGGNATLQVNGAGMRSKNFFDICVLSLYLNQKQTSAEAIFADDHEGRIAMHFVYPLGSERLFRLYRGD